MKGRFFIGIAVTALALVAFALGASHSFRAVAQDNVPSPPPPVNETRFNPPPVVGVRQPQPQSLPELIDNLKELRKQEEHLVAAIKEKLKAQKKALADSEQELRNLGVEPGENNTELNTDKKVPLLQDPKK